MKKIWNRLTSIRTKNDLLIFVQDLEAICKRLSSSIQPDSWWRNAAMTIPRVSIGIMLLSSQWRLKMGMPVNQLQEVLSEDKLSAEWITWIDPGVLLWIDRLESIALGGMIMTGFNTRLSALSILWTMSERVYLSLIHPLTSSFLMSALVVVATYSVIFGSGKFGADYWILKVFRKNRSAKRSKEDQQNS